MSGNADASFPRMRRAGDAIAFVSAATDLAPGSDANGARDVLLWQVGGAVVRLSSTPAGNAANSSSDNARIADDASVAFDTLGTDFGPADTNAEFDVYVSRALVFANGFE
jgi:hypothetical protein